ncbi:hypothetical protein G6F58_013544 [Rhizopus delemar]|nr:hypothetical protein G6F58_013544 [Rhizopus delemar]
MARPCRKPSARLGRPWECCHDRAASAGPRAAGSAKPRRRPGLPARPVATPQYQPVDLPARRASGRVRRPATRRPAGRASMLARRRR